MLAIASAQASYYDLTKETNEAQECISFDARYPYFTQGIYIATYPGFVRSKEGWTAQYYGGVVTDDKGDKTLLQYSSWQMGGKGAPTSGIDFAYAGPHMSWQRSNWEGSSGGFKGNWPATEFKRDQWYRFVHRVWTPDSPSPGLGYAGVWMKSLETGEWYHLGTFKFPAELTGFNNMGGFNEHFTNNATKTCAVEFRKVYAIRSGKWTSEAEFNSRNSGGTMIKLTPSADKRSVLLETTATDTDPVTHKRLQVPVVPQKATLAQPDQPDFFDPVAVDKVTAVASGNRVAIQWAIDSKNAPQLGYEVTVSQGDTVLATEHRNEPETRLCTLDVKPGTTGPLNARVAIRDIFGRMSQAVSVPVAGSVPFAAATKDAADATAHGLSYRYFEAKTPWMALPDFANLASVREGAVDGPDLTPRLRRDGYAFEYTGFLVAPESALYTLSLTAASGVKLFIDDKPIIEADGYHSIACYKQAVPLDAGPHAFRLQYVQGPVQQMQPDDFLQLSWARQGRPDEIIPASAFRCRPVADQPTIAAAVSGAGVNLLLTAKVAASNHKVDRVEYYAQDEAFDYFSCQNAKAMDYFLGSTSDPSQPVAAAVWGGAQKVIRARLIYDGNRTIDSEPLVFKQSAENGAADGYRLTSLEHHIYPAGVEHKEGKLTLVGESMALYTKAHKGDVTLIAHLADITPDQSAPDQTRLKDAKNWFSGIILRANTEPRPGEPLGGAQIPFSTLVGSASGATRHCDSTMIDGAGNQPSGDIGSQLKWFKLVRRGQDITTFASKDGSEWKEIKKVNLPKLPEEIEIGFVHYSIPSATPIVHRATYDHISVEP